MRATFILVLSAPRPRGGASGLRRQRGADEGAAEVHHRPRLGGGRRREGAGRRGPALSQGERQGRAGDARRVEPAKLPGARREGQGREAGRQARAGRDGVLQRFRGGAGLRARPRRAGPDRPGRGRPGDRRDPRPALREPLRDGALLRQRQGGLRVPGGADGRRRGPREREARHVLALRQGRSQGRRLERGGARRVSHRPGPAELGGRRREGQARQAGGEARREARQALRRRAGRGSLPGAVRRSRRRRPRYLRRRGGPLPCVPLPRRHPRPRRRL